MGVVHSTALCGVSLCICEGRAAVLQELRRELNLLKNFAVSFGLLSMLTGLGGFYYFGFSYGGRWAGERKGV